MGIKLDGIMSKYYLKSNGKEVKFGDIVRSCKQITTEYGTGTFTLHVTLDESNVRILVEKGILIEKEDVNLNIEYFIKKFTKRVHLSDMKGQLYFNILNEKYPTHALQLLLKEVSLYFNSEEELKLAPFLYAISLLDGKVIQIKTEKIKSKEIPFATFVSKSKAKKAKGYLYPLFERLYGKQEDKECES